MLHVDLSQLAGGTLQEKFDREITRVIDALEISTLTSLVEYIKSRLADDFAEAGGIPKMIVHVQSETEVRLVSAFNGDMDRWEIAKVKASAANGS